MIFLALTKYLKHGYQIKLAASTEYVLFRESDWLDCHSVQACKHNAMVNHMLNFSFESVIFAQFNAMLYI